LKLNGTQQLLLYANYVNILGNSVHTIKENAEVLLIGRKKNGLEVNAEKISALSCLEIRMQDEVTI